VAPIPAGTAPPELKYPAAFMPPNSNVPMHTPDAKTAANTPATPPAAIPVETLIQSMKPEKPLVVEGATGGFGTASTTSQSTSSGVTSSTPP
jgi:hypothetical protein